MNNKVFIVQDIASLVKPIAEQYGVKEIYLFGSYARGEAVEKISIVAEQFHL